MGCMLSKQFKTPESFLRRIYEALDVETNTLNSSTLLDDLDCDSLLIVSTIAIVVQLSAIVLKSNAII